MGANARGKRDGTGPYKGSVRKQISGKKAVGVRKAAGKPCPVKKK